MASLNENTFGERTRFVLTLLNGVEVNTSSAWQWVGGFQPVTVSIEGNFAGSVVLYASLAPGGSGPTPTAPTGADADYPTLLPAAVTTPQILELPNSIWWVKAVIVFNPDDPHPFGKCYAYAAVG
jgi:hypothetical protein